MGSANCTPATTSAAPAADESDAACYRISHDDLERKTQIVAHAVPGSLKVEDVGHGLARLHLKVNAPLPCRVSTFEWASELIGSGCIETSNGGAAMVTACYNEPGFQQPFPAQGSRAHDIPITNVQVNNHARAATSTGGTYQLVVRIECCTESYATYTLNALPAPGAALNHRTNAHTLFCSLTVKPDGSPTVQVLKERLWLAGAPYSLPDGVPTLPHTHVLARPSLNPLQNPHYPYPPMDPTPSIASLQSPLPYTSLDPAFHYSPPHADFDSLQSPLPYLPLDRTYEHSPPAASLDSLQSPLPYPPLDPTYEHSPPAPSMDSFEYPLPYPLSYLPLDPAYEPIPRYPSTDSLHLHPAAAPSTSRLTPLPRTHLPPHRATTHYTATSIDDDSPFPHHQFSLWHRPPLPQVAPVPAPLAQTQCRVCRRRPATLLNTRCQHTCMCTSCGLSRNQSLDPRCPMCNQDLENLVPVSAPFA